MPSHHLKTWSIAPTRLAGNIILALWLALWTGAVAASTRAITELPLQQAGQAQWRLAAGLYQGQFRIDHSMTLRCEPGAILDGGGQGSTLTLAAPNIIVEGCTLRNWGRDLGTFDAGVFIQKNATDATVRGNRLRGPGFGIWVDNSSGAVLADNDIEGEPTLRSQDRGNGIHLYAVTRAKVSGNRVRHVRDGIYIDTSNGNLLEHNLLEDLRYGVHYMFSNDNVVLANTTRRTRTGFALMQSRKLTVIGNRSEQDENYGILMNYITHSTLRHNRVIDVRSGGGGDGMVSGAEGKGLFIYNSLFNIIENNRFERSTIGIHLTAGSEDNRIAGNVFSDNRQQVKYVASRHQEWSYEGRGNYWNNYLGWDRNNDGIGDIEYEPNDNVDRLVWRYPQVRLLMNSPGIELLRWVQRLFPVIASPGVQDSHPLMSPPPLQQEPLR